MFVFGRCWVGGYPKLQFGFPDTKAADVPAGLFVELSELFNEHFVEPYGRGPNGETEFNFRLRSMTVIAYIKQGVNAVAVSLPDECLPSPVAHPTYALDGPQLRVMIHHGPCVIKGYQLECLHSQASNAAFGYDDTPD